MLVGVASVGIITISCAEGNNQEKMHSSVANAHQDPVVMHQDNEIVWTDLIAENFESTINRGRIAIVYIGYPFSMPKETFSTILGTPLEGVDYYQIEADWIDPSKGNPFYNDFGVRKDGCLVVVLPDGRTQKFDFRDFSRARLISFLEERPINDVNLHD